MATRAPWTFTFDASDKNSAAAVIASRRSSAWATDVSVVPRVRKCHPDNSMTRVPVLILAAIAAALLLAAVVIALPLWTTVAGLTLVIAAFIGLALQREARSNQLTRESSPGVEELAPK